MSQRRNVGEIWDYFDKVENATKAVCKTCKETYSYKSTTANLKNHLKRKHLSIYLSVPSLVQGSVTVRTTEPLPSLPRLPTPTISCTVTAPAPTASTVSIASTSGATLATISSLVLPCSREDGPVEVTQNTGILKRRQNVMDTYVPKKISREQKLQIDRDVLELCIDSFHPFSIVEERSFRKLMRWIPGYSLPSRKTLSNSQLTLLYNATKEKIRPQVDADCDAICISLDLWTSRATESYIAVTGHYISKQNFELKTILLDCCHFEDNHTAVNIAAELRRILGEWGLAHKVNFSVTDNAPNVTNAVKDILGWKHYGCFAHSLNLVLHDSLEDFKDSIGKLKKIVAYFHKSTSGCEKLNRQQITAGKTPKRLVQSVETRWNSTFFMLERAVELKDELKVTMALINNDLPIISEEEWTAFSNLCVILKPFEEMTATMSGEKYVTGSEVIVVTRILQEAINTYKTQFDTFPIMKKFIATLEKKITIRLGNVFKSGTFSVCTFLDPRYKMAAFPELSDAEATKQRIQNQVQEMIGRQTLHNPTPNSSITATSASSTAWAIFDKFMYNTTQHRGTPLSKAIKEVQMYVDDDILPRKDEFGNFTSPQAWWYGHRHLYPNLAEIYRTNCNMVATSVSCERMFSKTGQIISDRRASLKTNKVRQLMFLNCNLDPMRFNL